ncbi:MAG: hypothetical protein ABL931_24320 [Usitatibacteraceae bacterium]
MVICPVAIAVGCKKCPIFKVCPVKSIIGDQKSGGSEDVKAESKPAARPAAKSTPKSARKPAARRGKKG